MSLQAKAEHFAQRLGIPQERVADALGLTAMIGSMAAAVATGLEKQPDPYIQGAEFTFEMAAFIYGTFQIEKKTRILREERQNEAEYQPQTSDLSS